MSYSFLKTKFALKGKKDRLHSKSQAKVGRERTDLDEGKKKANPSATYLQKNSSKRFQEFSTLMRPIRQRGKARNQNEVF